MSHQIIRFTLFIYSLEPQPLGPRSSHMKNHILLIIFDVEHIAFAWKFLELGQGLSTFLDGVALERYGAALFGHIFW